MRLLSLVMSLALFVGCASTGGVRSAAPDELNAVESAILWEAELDEAWIPVRMANLVADSTRFEKQGNFYKVKDDLVVFGQKTSYVGMLGVHLTPGPNAVLEADPKTIAAYISRHFDAKFKSRGDTYVCDYKTYIKIIIEKHPSLQGSSIVIGAYTGP